MTCLKDKIVTFLLYLRIMLFLTLVLFTSRTSLPISNKNMIDNQTVIEK